MSFQKLENEIKEHIEKIKKLTDIIYSSGLVHEINNEIYSNNTINNKFDNDSSTETTATTKDGETKSLDENNPE